VLQFIRPFVYLGLHLFAPKHLLFNNNLMSLDQSLIFNIDVEKRIFFTILLFDLFFNSLVIVYKLWFIESLLVLPINLSFILAIIISYVFFKVFGRSIAFNTCLLLHLVIFTIASFFHVTYYSTILIYLMGVVIPFYWTENKTVHLFYLAISLILGVIYINNLLMFPIAKEGYRIIVEALIFFGLAFCCRAEPYG